MFVPGEPSIASYVAVGGIGLGTPALSLDKAGKDAGAYRFDGPTPDKAFIDGLRQTAQIIETNLESRSLAAGRIEHVCAGSTRRPCRTSASTVHLAAVIPAVPTRPWPMARCGSSRTRIDPAIFRAMLTLAGGPGEQELDSP